MDRSEDGSIFIDRDGKHFGQVLEYLRDGVLSVAEKEASDLDVSELRWLKREFGFYCIELYATPQEVAFVVGGTENDDIKLASMEGYDVASGAWREVASMAIARSDFSLCTLFDGVLYATGGYGIDNETFASVERYEPYLDTWSTAPSMPRPRRSHCACAVGDMMYVLGGIEKNQEEVDESMDSVLKFDCRMQTWSEVAIIPEVRDNAGACVLGSDIYIFGGNDENYTATSTTYRFSTATNEWATLAPMPEAKSQHSVSVLNGLICILGGLDSDDDDECINSVHRFDPTSNLWSAVAPMSVARASLGSFVMDGIIYAVSGFSKGSRLSSMERYSVALDSWSDVRRGELGAARSCFGAVVVQVEVDFFDSLIAKAQSEGLSSAC